MIYREIEEVYKYDDGVMRSGFWLSSDGNADSYRDQLPFVITDTKELGEIKFTLEPDALNFGECEGLFEEYLWEQVRCFLARNPLNWKLTVINPEPDRVRLVFQYSKKEDELLTDVLDFVQKKHFGKRTMPRSKREEVNEAVKCFDSDCFYLDLTMPDAQTSEEYYFSLKVQQENPYCDGDVFYYRLWWSVDYKKEQVCGIYEAHKKSPAYRKIRMEWQDDEKKDVYARVEIFD